MAYEEMNKKQMMEEIQKLQEAVERYDRYKQVEKAAGELKAVQMAFVNAGFTEEQAFELIKTSLPLAAKMM